MQMNASRLNVRRLLAHATLGLILLFVQQHALGHWLSHAVEAVQAKTKGAPTDVQCLECDGLAAFDGTLPTGTVAFPALPRPRQVQLALPEPPRPAAAGAAGYLSRAPPFQG